jgi:hypothetical protein
MTIKYSEARRLEVYQLSARRLRPISESRRAFRDVSEFGGRRADL